MNQSAVEAYKLMGSGQLLVQQYTLVERHQIVVLAVQQAQRRQALQMRHYAILVVWDKNHNSNAL